MRQCETSKESEDLGGGGPGVGAAWSHPWLSSRDSAERTWTKHLPLALGRLALCLAFKAGMSSFIWWTSVSCGVFYTCAVNPPLNSLWINNSLHSVLNYSEPSYVLQLCGHKWLPWCDGQTLAVYGKGKRRDIFHRKCEYELYEEHLALLWYVIYVPQAFQIQFMSGKSMNYSKIA